MKKRAWWRRWGPWTSVAVLVLAALAWLYRAEEFERTNEGGAAAAPSPLSVAVVEIPRVGLSAGVSGEGTVAAIRREVLLFELPGRIVEVGHDEHGEPLRPGSRVVRGQFLARIDARNYQQDVAIGKTAVRQVRQDVRHARARYEQAEASLRLATAHLSRAETLHRAGSVTVAALEEARAQVQTARAGVAMAKAAVTASKVGVTGARARLSQAELGTEKAELRAPFDGVIASMNARVGDYASPEHVDRGSADGELATAPFVVIDPSGYEVTVELPEFRARSVAPGQSVVIASADAALSNDILFAGPPETWPASLGRVYAVDQSISPVLRTRRVRVRTWHKPKLLRDGGFVLVYIVTDTRHDVVVAPLDGLIFREDRAFGFVVDPDSGRAERRAVDVGLLSVDEVEVVGGLAEGEWLATKGRHRLVDGVATSVESVEPAELGWYARLGALNPPSRDEVEGTSHE